jgi:hypothetical protein
MQLLLHKISFCKNKFPAFTTLKENLLENCNFSVMHATSSNIQGTGWTKTVSAVEDKWHQNWQFSA